MSGLPPAYIVTAGFDPLRDGAVAYAENLKQAGVAVSHVDLPDFDPWILFRCEGLQSQLSGGAVAAAAHAVRDALK